MNTKKEKTIEELEAEAEVSNDISDVKWFDIPVLLIFFVLFVIVALQFITRYILNDSLSWTEEIARYTLIMLAFVGSASNVRKHKHIFLEFFYRYLSAKAVKVIVLIVEVLVGSFFAYVGWLCLQLANETTQNMVSVNLPKNIVYYIVTIACFISFIFAVFNIVKYLKSSAEEIYTEKLNIKDH
ncbi:TRAP transporter small permease [uncultured Cocleimonas sp.]|uniref:TRAP transporter small permease n=1 Tax=uncultured Cocleimonas sp. TaxID=1051587 RepID=UPI002606CDD5|nr:TRAP transporter small permease [uncultured Cocleimonas sp.]